MIEPKKCQEYLRHTFDAEEKAVLSAAMAQAIGELATAEDELKAIKSDFKSRIDRLQAEINDNARKVNNGYEMRYIDCEKIPDTTARLWTIYRLDSGEEVKKVRMTEDDIQAKLSGFEQ